MSSDQIYNWYFYIITTVTFLIQVMAVDKLIRSGKYKPFVNITVMFLLSNVTVGLNEYLENNTSNNAWLAVCSFSLAISWGLSNMAHWSFAYEYYSMVRIIPFVLDDIPLPDKIFN